MTKPNGRAAFVAITLAEGLDPASAARATEAAPDFGDAGVGYRSLVSDAGYRSVQIHDVTADYADTLDAWTTAWERQAEAVAAVVGAEEFEDRQARRRRAAAGVAEGLIVRQLVTAIA